MNIDFKLKMYSIQRDIHFLVFFILSVVLHDECTAKSHNYSKHTERNTVC